MLPTSDPDRIDIALVLLLAVVTGEGRAPGVGPRASP